IFSPFTMKGSLPLRSRIAVPQTGQASDGKVEMSGGGVRFGCLRALDVFIGYLVAVERDDHALGPYDQLHVQHFADDLGLEYAKPFASSSALSVKRTLLSATSRRTSASTRVAQRGW